MIGWSGDIVPPEYVRSSSVASTLTLPRGFRRKLYHSSRRVHGARQRRGRGMRCIFDLDRGVLNLGMAREVRADQARRRRASRIRCQPPSGRRRIRRRGGCIARTPLAARGSARRRSSTETRPLCICASESSVNTPASSEASTENPRALPCWRIGLDPGGNRIVSEAGCFGEDEDRKCWRNRRRASRRRLRVRSARRGQRQTHEPERPTRSRCQPFMAVSSSLRPVCH